MSKVQLLLSYKGDAQYYLDAVRDAGAEPGIEFYDIWTYTNNNYEMLDWLLSQSKA